MEEEGREMVEEEGREMREEEGREMVEEEGRERGQKQKSGGERRELSEVCMAKHLHILFSYFILQSDWLKVTRPALMICRLYYSMGLCTLTVIADISLCV